MTAQSPPLLFDDWKRCLLQRPTELCTIHDASVVDFTARAQQYQFRATPIETLALFNFTLRNLSAIAKHSTEPQIVYGLNSIFNGSYDNICHDVFRAASTPESRLEAIQSVYALYADFLSRQCAQVLGHRSETSTGLETFHYMMWDASPLLDWASIQEPTTKTWPFLDMLERVLYLPHDGCIESALHGLGHAVDSRRRDQPIPVIIERFLAVTPGLRPELRAYALAARTGHIL
ncbi:MAG: hypothetical protein K2Y05_12585 [Hyphomicrobiaceae bacterium]|nr:hypothetical protein [Hyphomicrobiaceae bacterium]